jgi:hypothetical protein
MGTYVDTCNVSTDPKVQQQVWGLPAPEVTEDPSCEACQGDDSLVLLGDLEFCPSCSRLLKPVNLGIAKYTLRSPDVNTFGPPEMLYQQGTSQLPSNLPTPTSGAYSWNEQYSTKLEAVAQNLAENRRCSKR